MVLDITNMKIYKSSIVETVVDTINLRFERIHATPEMVTSAMQLYFTGESLRNIQKFLKLQGVKITHVSIYNWIRKYVALRSKVYHVFLSTYYQLILVPRTWIACLNQSGKVDSLSKPVR
jgi:hypothetical protein